LIKSKNTITSPNEEVDLTGSDAGGITRLPGAGKYFFLWLWQNFGEQGFIHNKYYRCDQQDAGRDSRTGQLLFGQSYSAGRSWGYYLKPVDISLGSATASSPNNISFGLPFGFVNDLARFHGFIPSLYLEAAPR
jgi:hypothetical protein